MIAALASQPEPRSGPARGQPVATSAPIPARDRPEPRTPVPSGRQAAALAAETPEPEAMTVAPAASATANANPDETNVWPDESAEAAFLAEARSRGETPQAVAKPSATDDDEERAPKALPPLSELVERIPAETRELLDELFRAKFVAVRKVKKSDLKPADSAESSS